MMKLDITEEQLRRIISDAVDKYLNEEVGNACPWNPRKLRLIREGLIMSYPADKVVSIIGREINLDSIGNGVSVGVVRKGQSGRLPYTSKRDGSTKKNLDTINELPTIWLSVGSGLRTDGYVEFMRLVNCCNRCGYFLSCIIINGDYAEKDVTPDLWSKISEGKVYVEIIFEPKFDAVVAPEDIPTKCYHICPTRAVSKICSGNGLTPHDNGRVSAYPDRVYLFMEKPHDWHDIAVAFSETSCDKDFTLLGVNMREMIGKTKFRYDPNTYGPYPVAIYTEESIPSVYIKPLDRFIIG